MSKRRILLDAYRSPGLVKRQKSRGYSETRRPGSSGLHDVKKTACGCCGTTHGSFYDRKVRRIRDLSCGEMRIHMEVEVRRVWCPRYGKVKQEKFPWLADNPFYTKRFAWYVGRRCRQTVVKDVARKLKLDWKMVKVLDKEYMRE